MKNFTFFIKIRKTLRFQIYATIAIALLCIAVIYSLILYPFEKQRRETVIRKIELSINAIAEQQEAMIANQIFLGHREAGEAIIRKMLETEGMIAIGIFNPDASLFAATDNRMSLELPKSYKPSQAYSFAEAAWHQQDVVTYTKAIMAIGEHLGYLRIHYSLTDVVKEARQAVVMFTGLLLTILLTMAVLLNMFLSRFVIRPVGILMNAMRKVRNGHLGMQVHLQSENEIGRMARTFNEMSSENARMYQEIHELNKDLEKNVEDRTLELNNALGKIMDSIHYAQRIQISMLPNPDETKSYLPESFFLWMPRDIVGGDIYFTESFEDGIVIAVIDCTGHGVPGAFMSMIALSFIRRITTVSNCHDPSEILKQLNLIIKTSLQQETDYASSDDGLDAAVCFVQPEKNILTFSGARLPLFYVHNNKMKVIRGDRQSIGYRRSDMNFDFTAHTVSIEKGMSFYMSTDGYWDQLGPDENGRFGQRSFGRIRFQNLLEKISRQPFEKQEKILLEAFNEYKGDHERQDDVTVAGFGF